MKPRTTPNSGDGAKPGARPEVIRGGALIDQINDHADRHGLTQRAIARVLGISESHYSQLLNRERDFASLPEEKLRAIAELLDVPYMSVLMLAEIVRPEDFFRSSTIEDHVTFAYRTMRRDSRFVVAMPNAGDWKAAPLSVRLLCAILYQDVSGQDLLEKARLIRVEKRAEGSSN